MRILTAVTLVLSAIYAQADNSTERCLEGKYVAITGGAGDMCSAMAKKFLEHGARFVILIDKDKKRGEEVKKKLNEKYGKGKVEFIHADVNKDLERVVKVDVPKYGLAEVLVNCAGVLNENSARSTIETNLLANIKWSDKMYELSRADKGGNGSTIINMSDNSAYTVLPYIPLYAAASAGTVAYTKSKGHERNYRKTKVRMFSILPGFTITRMTAGPLEVEEKNEEFTRLSKTLIKQTPEEFADAFIDLFPVAETGSAHTIDGGKHFESPALVYISAEDVDKALQS